MWIMFFASHKLKLSSNGLAIPIMKLILDYHIGNLKSPLKGTILMDVNSFPAKHYLRAPCLTNMESAIQKVQQLRFI